MNTSPIILFCIAWLISDGLAEAHEGDQKPYVKVIHIKNYDNYIITTADDRIKIWTKEDPFDGKATDTIEGNLLIAPKLAEKMGGWADLCIFKDSSTKWEDLVLQVSLLDEGTSRDAQTKGYHYYHFIITKDLFNRAIFGIGNDEETINLHCHKADVASKKDNTDNMDPHDKSGEQVGADQPATAPELKSEGTKTTKPHSEVRPR